MKDITNYKVILWDFDGVIMDSMPIRDQGFEEVLKEYSKEDVARLMIYHKQNGGLSRYMKFRYFYEHILKKQITDLKIQELANTFSKRMIEMLIDPQLLIQDTMTFIKNNYKHQPMHIVSGSDGDELRFLCQKLNIDQYFRSIHGSPTSKTDLVKKLLERYEYLFENVILVGDSINDYHAAIENRIAFIGYNNELLKKKGLNYIDRFPS